MPQDSMWQGILKKFLVFGWTKQGLTSTLKLKIFQDSPSYQIFRRMHGVLNIDENKN